MAISKRKRETLPVRIKFDPSTRLPLLSEQEGIFNLVLAYRALPYSIVEYGCGKKASMILNYLVNLGIPPYALGRGMIMERDMSPGALSEKKPSKRQHALLAENPVYKLVDFKDSTFREMIAETHPEAKMKAEGLQAGPYLLHHWPEVQFVIARSHVFVELAFWDEQSGRAIRRVIDPALNRTRPFATLRLREYLQAPEALIFRAPLLERFMLEEELLTDGQAEAVAERLGRERQLHQLSDAEHNELVRRLNGAEPGSIGDPDTWSYANNIRSRQLIADPQEPDYYHQHDSEQLRITHRSMKLKHLTRDLLCERESRGRRLPPILADLQETIDDSNLKRILSEDARWSKNELQILANIATTMSYFRTLGKAAQTLRAKQPLTQDLDTPETLRDMRGIGVRLRRRIDQLADVSRSGSRSEEDPIHAQAFTRGFVRATIETIRQMNQAGLTVFVDKVGNIHGLLFPPEKKDAWERTLRENKTPLSKRLASRMAHVSHIDTVSDAGKFDGRLGVLGGVETAHLLRDLRHYHHVPLPDGDHPTCLQVSSYVGEEMTFTGRHVSMPGSAAVAERASCEQIYQMENARGETWKALLVKMLHKLQEAQKAKRIHLFNDFIGTGDDPEALLRACSEPSDFFTPHTFERHIEQGPVLDREDVPLVLVDTVMGIHQEDFTFYGDRAEAAAAGLISQLRDLAVEMEKEENAIRATVGIFESHSDKSTALCHEDLGFAVSCRLEGELNHAGSTPNPDRRDPAVAASRLATEFHDYLVSELRVAPEKILIGNVYLEPGTNRNVIPGVTGISLAVKGEESLSRDSCKNLRKHLESFITLKLESFRGEGGEGVALRKIDDISFICLGSTVTLSLDLRFAQTQMRKEYLERLEDICDSTQKKFGVSLERKPQQSVSPQKLEERGQALIIERSFGGSHTPRETELLSDIIRGCALQADVSIKTLSMDTGADDFNLFRLVKQRIPSAWLERRDRFTSGALHDTCNIAAQAGRAQSPRDSPNPEI